MQETKEHTNIFVNATDLRGDIQTWNIRNTYEGYI
jgi:hypothetical protein